MFGCCLGETMLNSMSPSRDFVRRVQLGVVGLKGVLQLRHKAGTSMNP